MEEKILDFDRDWEALKKIILPDSGSEEAEAILCGVLGLAIAN
jgi:hypothetical protein